MKTVYTLLFVLFSMAVFAQQHELQLEYQPFKKEELGQGGGINYYFNLSPKYALGIKGSFFAYGDESYYFKEKRQTYSLDLVHRINLLNAKKLRLFVELGGTYTLEYHDNKYDEHEYFIGCFTGVIFPVYFEEGPVKINRLGLMGSTGIDYTLFKHFIVGSSYSIQSYLLSDRESQGSKVETPTLNFYIGYKF